jgi:hypothetical protein
MKRKITLSISAIFSVLLMNAQTNSYIPFPDLAFSQRIETAIYGGVKHTYFTRELKGDTIVNGIKYIKCYEPTLKSGIRNDIPNKKVYSYDFNSKTEILLYDFNLKLGDTVLITHDYKYWVEKIDSVLLLDKIYHNRIIFSIPKQNGMTPPPTLSPLIEGLGYEHGNKFSEDKFSEGSTQYSIICASANKKILVAKNGVPPSGEYCGGIISNISTNEKKNDIALYPNPTTGKFQLIDESGNAYAAEVITILGKQIVLAPIQNNAVELDLSNQPEGVYFVVLHNNDGTSTSKRIVRIKH